jgi:hypothetical protein
MQSHALSFLDLHHTPQPTYPPSGYHGRNPKRRRVNPGLRPLPPPRDIYACLYLEKDRRIYLEEEDAYRVLTPEWVEWNPAIRRCIGRLPRNLVRRLAYLSRFHRETVIYHPFEDIVLADHLQDQMYGAYYRECRLKRAMRNLLGRWKCLQMARRSKGAAVDPVTLSEPEKPVVVYSWAQGRRYTFEAKTLSLHVEAQLCHHSGGFPVPQVPRNPWNNVAFSFRELISIYLQLKSWGELRWGLLTFHGAQFDLEKWGREQRTLLTRKALEDAMRTLPHLPLLRQSMLQFITDALEEGHCDHLEDWKIIYEYALEYLSDHAVIQQWGQWYIQSHVQRGGVVYVELPKIWKRQHQLSRAILMRERWNHPATVAAAY